MLCLASGCSLELAPSEQFALAEKALGQIMFSLPQVDDAPILTKWRNQVMCTGDADHDTEALQRAFDQVQAHARPGYRTGRIELSAGVCTIHKTISIAAKRGIVVQGQGTEQTTLRWVGDDQSPLLYLQRTADSVFSNFAIYAGAGKTLHSGIDIDNDCNDPVRCGNKQAQGVGIVSTNNRFNDIAIWGHSGTLDYGVRVLVDKGGLGTCNDKHRFDGVKVGKYRESGFLLEGINGKQIVFTGCNCSGYNQKDVAASGKSCVSTKCESRANCNAQSSASFSWFGGGALGHRVADFILGGNADTIRIAGLYSEKSRMLLYKEHNNSFGNRSFPVIVENVQFASHFVDQPGWQNSGGLIVEFSAQGPLIMRGNSLGTIMGDGYKPFGICFRGNSKRKGGTFVFEGNALATPLANPFAGDPAKDCRYPTTQASNLVLTKSYAQGGTWEPMPQHLTLIDTNLNPSPSVYRLSSSRSLMGIVGQVPLETLKDGVVGQTITVIGMDPSGSLIVNGGGNIRLKAHQDVFLTPEDTLTLRHIPGNLWVEVSRSAF